MKRKVETAGYRIVLLVGKVTILLFCQLFSLSAQVSSEGSYREIRDDAEERYGPSAELYNGKKYQNPYRHARGNPFFRVQHEPVASVQIRGKVYDHLSIMYDMYNQVMILEVVDSTGGPGSIELRNEWIDQVIIDGVLFKLYEDVAGKQRFGQVIFEGEVSCIYFWEKRYLPDMHEGENRYFFTEPGYEACIFTDGKTIPYHGNRSFLKCFDSGLIPVIKTYLRDHHLNVKKASESEMKSLMRYLNGMV